MTYEMFLVKLFKEKTMIVEKFSLIELLLTRQWLMAAGSSHNSFGMNKEQYKKIDIRLREVDAELTLRVIDGADHNIVKFDDLHFEDTLKELRDVKNTIKKKCPEITDDET
jgi:hypothetical protein